MSDYTGGAKPEFDPNNPYAEQYGSAEYNYIKMQGGKLPMTPEVLPAQGEVFTRSYWEQPQRIARYFNALQSIPPDQTPPGIERDKLELAYHYLARTNLGKQWFDWQMPDSSDSIHDLLKSMPVPPASMLPDYEQKDWANWQEGQATPPMTTLDREMAKRFLPDDVIARLNNEQGDASQPYVVSMAEMTPYAQKHAQELGMDISGQPAQPTGDRPFGLTEEQFNDLPLLDKGLLYVFGSKAGQIATAATQTAVVGAVIGTPFLPGVGTAIGGAIGGAIGVGMGLTQVAAQEPNAAPWLQQAAKAMLVMNIPFQTLENAIGTGVQAGASVVNPDKYGTLQEFFQQLPEAWQAGQFMYDANTGLLGKNFDAKAGTFQVQGLRGKTTLEGTPLDVYTGAVDAWAMSEVRHRLVAGETAEAVFSDMTDKLGMGGMSRNLVAQMVADPLNLLGDVEVAGVKQFGKATHNAELVRAAELSRGDTMGLLRDYRLELRKMTPDELAMTSTFARMIAGADANGVVWHGADVKQTFLQRMIDLRPESKAHEIVGDSETAITALLSNEQDSTGMRSLLNSTLEDAKPLDAVKAAEESPLPHYFESAEFQPVVPALKEQLPKAIDLLDSYDNVAPQRQIIGYMAEMLGEEPYKLMKRLNNADDITAEGIWKGFVSKVETLAASKDQRAANFLQIIQNSSMSNDPMSGKLAKSFAKMFTEEGTPYDMTQLKFYMTALLRNGVEDWSVKWLGIKEQNWFVRMSDVIKKAQGIALLGYNPSYAMNNGINNFVTMSWDGLVSLNSRASNETFIQDMGMDTSQIREGWGIGQADPNAPIPEGQPGQAIANAQRGEGGGWLQWTQDKLGAVGRSKYLFATYASKAIEQYSSEMAMTTAMREYWTRTWEAGNGFRKVPPTLSRALEVYEPGLTQKVERMISKGKNRAQIEETLFGKYQTPSVRDVLDKDNIALLDGLGILPGMEEQLKGATTPEEVSSIFQQTRMNALDKMAKKAAGEGVQVIESTRAMVKAGGFKPALETMQSVKQSRADFFDAHYQRLERVWADAEGKPPETRKAMVWNALDEEDKLWTIQQNDEAARIVGISEGIGANHEVITQHLMDIHTVWDGYFKERRKLWQDYGDTVFTDAKEAATSRDKIYAQLDRNYQRSVDAETILQGKVDEVFAQAFDTQFGTGSGTQARAWLKSVHDVELERTAAVAYFRSGKTSKYLTPETIAAIDAIVPGGKGVQGLQPGERSAAWKQWNSVHDVITRKWVEAQGKGAELLKEPAPIVTETGKANQLAQNDVGTAQVQVGDQRLPENAQARIDWEYMATHDSLLSTLKNKRGFDIDLAARQTANQPTSVAYWDLRGLKTTNDIFGHETGDTYLKAVQQVLADEGLSEQAYRMGGDEFTALFDSPEQAKQAMQGVTKRLESSIIEVRYEDGTTKQFTGAKTHYGIGDSIESADAASRLAKSTAGFGEGRDYKLTELTQNATGDGSVSTPAAEGLGAGSKGSTGTGGTLADEQQAAIERATAAKPTGDNPAAGKSREPDVAQPIVDEMRAKNLVAIDETGQIHTPEGIEISNESKRTTIRQMVHEADPSITADAHILNIIKKYGGEEAQNFVRLEQVPKDIARQAFEARRVEKMTPEERLSQNNERIAGLKESIAASAEQNAPRIGTRSAFDQYLRETNPAQASASMDIFDQIAKTWARENNSTPDQWWERILPADENTPKGGLEQTDSQQWYYSALTRTIDEKMPNRATPEQIHGMMTGRVKADELKWTGFDEWLNEQTGPVTKEDVQNFLRENEVQVKEVVKGAPENKYDIVRNQEESDYAGEDRYDLVLKSNGRVSFTGNYDEAVIAMKNDNASQTGGKTPQYAQYTTPGGNNYRELLLTLPDQTSITTKAMYDSISQKMYGVPYDQLNSKAPARANAVRVKAEELKNENYHSPHWDWDEINVLTHTRFSDFIDADGKRVMMIDEIQSDWHQAGREKGYSDSPSPYKTTDQKSIEEGWGYNGDSVEFPTTTEAIQTLVDKFGLSRSEAIKFVDETNELSNVSSARVPAAPFSKTWEELTIKRIIRWASENKYDRVAWTTGEQQAARYALSKQVDAIAYRTNPDGTYNVSAQSQGKGIPLGDTLTSDKLADVVGKDVASRIVNGEGKAENWAANNEPSQEYTVLRGMEQLSVGGQGMKGFYDEKIPNIIRKYIKKWGSDVGETQINGQSVHSFDVTPAMRESAMQGQPLFQQGQDVTHGSSYIFRDPEGISKSIIAFTQSSNPSTVIHEVMGHTWLATTAGDADKAIITNHFRTAAQNKAPWLVEWLDTMKYDTTDIEKLANLPDNWADLDTNQYTTAHELWGRTAERYFADGVAPKGATPAIIAALGKFKDWIYKVYTTVLKGKLAVEISPEVRAMMDKWLSDNPELGKPTPELQPAPGIPNVWDAKPAAKPQVYGKPTTARGITNPENTYDFKYKVVDMGDLLPSHHWDGDTLKPNGLYPQELQPRLREDQAQTLQVDTIARKLVPDELLFDAKALDRGAPIIGSDNMVESGNGRVLALQRAAERYPEQYQAYLTSLKSELQNVGIDPQQIEGMQHPVLVRERTTSVDRMQFASDANKPVALKMNVMETALGDARLISDETLKNLDVGENESIQAALMSNRNTGFVQKFLQSLSPNERAELSNNGAINQTGIERITYALFAKVYPGEVGKRLLRTFSMSMDSGVLSAQNAVMSSLPQISRIEGLVSSGLRSNRLSIAEDVAAAIDKLDNIRKNKNMSVTDYLGQPSMLGDELTPTQKTLLKLIGDSRSPKRLRELLREYASLVEQQPDPNQLALFDAGKTVSKEDLLNTAIRNIEPDIPEGQGVLFQQDNEPTPAIGAAHDVTTALQIPPTSQAVYEGYLQKVMPALDEAERSMTSKWTEYYQPDPITGKPVQQPSALSKLSKEDRTQVMKYLGGVYTEMADSKIGMMRYSKSRRDAALLNYGRQYGFDTYLSAVMPYQLWYTRSMVNWMARILANPSIVAKWARLMTAGDNMQGEGYPTRLKQKNYIPIPFISALAPWMGSGIFIDPMNQAFPMMQLIKPFANLYDQGNMVTRSAESNVSNMLQNGDITPQQAQEAAATHKGQTWDTAMAKAQNESDLNVRNPVDFAFSITGASLPISMAYNALTGRKDRISQLPITKLVQNVTAAVGIGGPRGLNIEAPIRKLTGLPEVDRFEDYRVDRMLANMAAEGVITTKDAQTAMIDRNSPAFTAAQKRVSQMGFWQYFGAPLALDFFPEGEKDQRELQTLYGQARAKWAGGDDKALTTFFDEHPELQARWDSFKNPEDRLKSFIISEVWDKYNTLASIDKTQAQKQFGSLFSDAFLNKTTRSYDSINVETLTTWARMMGSALPKKAPNTANLPLQLADPAVSSQVDQYYKDRDAAFPGISAMLETIYKFPQGQQPQPETLNKYYRWKDKYFAEHPDVIPWLQSETSTLAGVPQGIATYVYKYRAEKDRQFPNVDALQNQYFSFGTSAEKRTFLKQNSDLAAYWDWRKGYAATYPKAAPYILSDTTLQKDILGTTQSNGLTPQIAQQFSPELTRQVMAWVYLNQQPSESALMELERIWIDNGKPEGTLNKWIATFQ